VADLDLRPERRNGLVARLRADLEAAVPGSTTSLRGSLATGSADAYSDIDLCWVVEDAELARAVSLAQSGAVSGVSTVRVDPDLARSERRRLLFLRLADAPLFWRVDLDIRSRSVATSEHHDEDNLAARDATSWSPAASALENALAAVRSHARGRHEEAGGLLVRGFERIGRELPPGGTPVGSVTDLAHVCADQDPGLTVMAAEVAQLAEALLQQLSPLADQADGRTA